MDTYYSHFNQHTLISAELIFHEYIAKFFFLLKKLIGLNYL